jgi:hypothetical protein
VLIDYGVKKERIGEMKRIGALLLALVTVLSFCACAHKHTWKEATCTEPRTCTECGATEGQPAGHKASWVADKTDVLNATRTMKQKCSVCGEELDTKEEELETFIDGKSFIFTGEEYVARLQKAWDEQSESSIELKFKYAINSNGKINFDIYNRNDAWLGWGLFYDENGEAIDASDEDTTVYSLRIIAGPISNTDIETVYYLFTLLLGPCVRAADPSIKDYSTYEDPVSNNYYSISDGQALNGLHYTCMYDKEKGTFKLDIDIAED